MTVACLVSACQAGGSTGTGAGSDNRRPTITQAQAERQVEDIIQTTIASLHPRPVLKRDTASEELGACTETVDPAFRGQMAFTRGYYLVGVKKDQYDTITRQAKALWARKGWTVLSARGATTEFPALFGRTPDYFRFAFETDYTGTMLFGAGSPCFWPNGTPRPT